MEMLVLHVTLSHHFSSRNTTTTTTTSLHLHTHDIVCLALPAQHILHSILFIPSTALPPHSNTTMSWSGFKKNVR